MAQQHSVYDHDADEHPVHHQLPPDPETDYIHPEHDEPETGLPEDESEGSGDRADKGDLKNAEERGGFYNRDGDKDGKSSGKASLNAAEGGDGDDGLFNPDADKGGGQRLKNFGRKNWKKLLWGVGGSAGIGGVIISLLLALSPLKVESLVTNLQTRFYAGSEQALSNGSDSLMSGYFRNHVLGQYRKCGTTRSRNCKVSIVGGQNNPVTNMYRSWSNARLENTLANKYNIEFKYNKTKQAWYLKAPDGPADGDNIGRNGEGLDREFQRTDRAGMRGAIRGAMEKETLSKRIMYRYKVGRLLEQKYGIKRCIVFCGTRDALGNNVDAKKQAAKLFLAERVLQPRSEMTFIAVRCLLDETCDPNKTTANADNDPARGETGGEPVSDVEVEGESRLAELAGQYGVEDVSTLKKLYGDMSEKGFTSYMIEKTLVKVFGVDAGKAAATRISNAIPIVGWIDLAATVVHTGNTADSKAKKLGYMVSAAASVSFYSMYRTYADEIHTGNVDSTEVGSFTDSFGQGTDDAKDPLVGGTAAADQSPLYSSIMNNQGASTVASIFAPGSASADSTENNPNYKCNNDKPVPSGKLVCSEEQLGQGVGALSAIHDFLNMPGMNVITTIANAWDASFHKIFSFVGGAVSFVLSPVFDALDASCKVGIGPVHLGDLAGGYCHVKPLIEDAAGSIMKALVSAVFPSPFGTNMGGGRAFDMAAQGAYVSGKDACNQMGCQSVSSVAMLDIVNQQETEARREFESRPLMARMFATDTPYSLASTLAISMPSTGQSILRTTASTISANPITTLTHSFATMLGGKKTMAASTEAVDPFHGGTVAFPKNKIPSDMEAYWDSHNCGDESENGPIAKWQKAAENTTDPDTGMPVHTDTEPCLLIKNLVGDLGGKYDTSLLSDDEKQVYEGTSQGAAGDAGSTSDGSIPGGSSQDLAKQLLPYIKSGKIFCGPAAGGSGSADCSDIQHTAAGTPIGGNCAVKALTPHLLGLLLALVKDKGWSFGLSATCSDHHPEGDGPYAGHSYGSTTDFSVETKDGKRASGAAAASNQAFVNDVADILSGSGGSFGQVGNCHPIYSSQKDKKFTTFNDACNHQHVRAAP